VKRIYTKTVRLFTLVIVDEPHLDHAKSKVQQTSKNDYEVKHVPAVSEIILGRRVKEKIRIVTSLSG